MILNSGGEEDGGRSGTGGVAFILNGGGEEDGVDAEGEDGTDTDLFGPDTRGSYHNSKKSECVCVCGERQRERKAERIVVSKNILPETQSARERKEWKNSNA